MIKSFKKIFSLLMIIGLLLSLVACEETKESSTGITNLIIQNLFNKKFYCGKTSNEFKVDVIGNLEFSKNDINVINNDPSIASIIYEKKESWLSSNHIAFTITGLKPGKTSFYFETIDKVIKTETIEIEVLQNFTSINFDNTDKITIDDWSSSDNDKLSFSYESNETIDNLTDELEFISENPEVATIKYDEDSSWLSDQCIIEKKKPGKTYVYIQTKDGTIKSEKIEIEILRYFKSINFDNTEKIVFDEWSFSDAEELSFSYESSKTIDNITDELEFISENPKIATIKYDEEGSWLSDKCVIEKKKPGKTFVYIQTKDGTIKSEKVKVVVKAEETEPPTVIEETTVDNSRTVYITPYGEKYHYSASCAGENAIETTENSAKTGHDPCSKCAQ